MPLPLLLLAAAAAQSTPASSLSQGYGRAFISPMGEPFFGRTAGEDGLSVWFTQADANHDGSISVEEMTADAERFFKRLDANHDGEIDPDEINTYEQTMQVRGSGYGLLNIPEPVMSADADFNRGVSLDEFRNAAAKRFQLLDLNHSGRLTLPVLVTDSRAAREQARTPAGDKAPAIHLDPDADSQVQPPE